MATEAQIAANRQNAQLSTGPKSDAGKSRSRANALKHGLCAVVVVSESAELLQERAWQVYEGLKPQNSYQAWMCDQVALSIVRTDRCQRMERRARDKVAFRALSTWDDDRSLEAKALGKRLASSPEEVAALLRKTPQGCDWLIDRWAQLAYAAREGDGRWTDEQTRLAFDLLGTPREFRQGRAPGVVLDRYGEVVDEAKDPVAVARRQVDELLEHREVALEADEIDRALAEADLTDGKDPEVRRYRRYEASLHRQIRWYVAQVKDPSPHKQRAPHLTPGWAPTPELPSEAPPEPEARPEPPMVEEVLAEEHDPDRINPPFDLEPDEYPEPGQSADIPQIVRDRKQKRLAKAESRREARRRKLDQFRA